MKNLGKQSVTLASFLNGEPSNERQLVRTVYEKADGTFWVNHLTSQREVKKLPSGKFYWRFDVRTIASKSVKELFT